MAITASMVKELRERTGAGMMECKKALTEADGNLDAAIDQMRKSGMAKADKKAGRVAAEGLLAIKVSDDGKSAVIVEVNSETDFVSKADDFISFVDEVAKTALAGNPADIDALSAMSTSDGTSVENSRKALIARLGENIQVRRFQHFTTEHAFGSYKHGVRIGVLVEIKGGNDELARDVSMHIAASRPLCVSDKEVPAETLAKEKEIFVAQAKDSGKPDNIIEKMVEGRMRKYLGEITLLGQAFVKDPDQTIGKLLESNNAEIIQFVRMEVGEGIEKKTENFADEVMAQMGD
ncbi:MAG TPA: elongation factor Ts [Gammaproteobacteria bacterium]|nr:elongation factor Ts [Gammaproteobacteria bacterium]